MESPYGAYHPKLPKNVTDNINLMSGNILTILLNYDLFHDPEIVNDIRGQECGYLALHNIMRRIHPRLMERPPVYNPPSCKNVDNISAYINNWKHFLLQEQVQNRIWTPYQYTVQLISRLPDKLVFWVMNEFEAGRISQRVDIPIAFGMGAIGMTIQSIAKRIPDGGSTVIRQLTSNCTSPLDASSDDFTPDDIQAIVHAVQTTSNPGTKNTTKCLLCNVAGHDILDCYQFIDYNLCQQLSKTNPELAKKILARHKTSPRFTRHTPNGNSTSSAPSSTVRNLTADLSPLSLDDTPDDNPGIVHCLTANVQNFDTYFEPPILFDPHDHDDDLSNRCHSLHFDFPIEDHLGGLDDVRSNPDGLLPENPHLELFREDKCVRQVSQSDTNKENVSPPPDFDTQVDLWCDGISDPVAPPPPYHSPVVAQIDGGANVSTTNQASILWNVHKLDRPKFAGDVGGVHHVSHYRGFIVLEDKDGTQKSILTYFTPTIHATIICPHTICDQYSTVTQFTSVADVTTSTGIISFLNKQDTSVFQFPFTIHNGLIWTHPVIRPDHHQRRHHLPRNIVRCIRAPPDFDNPEFFDDDDTSDILQFISPKPSTDVPPLSTIHQLTLKAQSHLYHQRLGHLNFRDVSTLHHHVDGIPRLPEPSVIDSCPVCLAAKLRKSNTTSTPSPPIATTCFQIVSIDMGFIVQQSKNTKRLLDYTGISGETCYIALTCAYSGTIFGRPLVNKGPPLEWLHHWLARYSPDVPDKRVRMDQGGELGKCKQVKTLFEKFGYSVEVTGADASHQNGLVERSHQTIGNMLRSLLIGNNVPLKLWPYAFYHCIFLLNRIVHTGKESPPITICSGQRVTLQGLRTFGCRVYVKLPGKRPAKLDTNHRIGIFVGYANTMRNIFWYDTETNRVKIATHYRFDEGSTDLAQPTPNIQIIRRQEDDNVDLAIDDDPLPEVNIHVEPSPFREISTITIPINCDLPTFGLELQECHIRHRAYISGIAPNSSAHAVRNFARKYVGSFIIEIDGHPIFDLNDASQALQQIFDADDVPSFQITLAPDRYIPVRDRREHLSLDINQVRHITTLRQLQLPDDQCITNDDIIHYIRSVVDSSKIAIPMSHDELDLNGRYTRRRLKTLTTWRLWKQSEAAQLDKMEHQHMFGTPCKPPPDAIILNQLWRYYFKDGHRKARQCCDGSPRAAPFLHEVAATYASCIEQPILRLFYALCAYQNLVILTTDAVNAFANADAPTIPTYVRIDDAYAEWYYEKYHVELDRSLYLPAQHALQGHPESPRLWEQYITNILRTKLNLVSTTHERSIYSGTYEGHKILVTRQVDDIAVAAPTLEIAQNIIRIIGESVHIEGNDLLTKFNGVDVEQTRHYIRLHCEPYIDTILSKHGWDTPLDHSPGSMEPIPASMFKQVDDGYGPLEHTPEFTALATKHGFKFRTVIGELMYAYVICRLDIGYAITKLSQFAHAPDDIHYQCLKRLCLYLRSTKTWGLIYWRQSPLEILPFGTFQPLPYHSSEAPTKLPEFPSSQNPIQLIGYVDASHATDLKTRRSVTGFVLTLSGAAICYRSKIQTSVATSSTESEFIAAVSASKTTLYLRSVLKELGFEQEYPTPMYEDNEAAINMINASKPTVRSRHIDIQHFAIQEWKIRGAIIFIHIAGLINIADAMTKFIGWILHARHTRRAMGHHLPKYVPSYNPHAN